MTTIPFLPNNTTSPPFQTTVTLDGATYTLTTMWNFYRGWWYVQLYDQNGNLVVNQPLVGSPPGTMIPLFPGLFTTSTISFVPSAGQFVQTP